MSVRVGIVGTGMIGTEHITSLTHHVAGAAVTAVFDVDGDRAHEIATAARATPAASAGELVRRDDVDAVLVATPGFTHAEIVLDCIAVGKPTFCEKPLATTAGDCVRIMEAEADAGRRLVQIGFMRRFDPGYLEVKSALDAGDIGVPVLSHMFHRNPEVPDFFKDDMVMNDAFIHEMDVVRWLFDDEVSGVRVLAGRSTPAAHEGLHDPMVLCLDTRSGVLVLAEAFVANGFGYDVRCEVVGSEGTVELTTPRRTVRTGGQLGSASRGESIQPGWKERFGDTYRAELKAWVDGVAAGTPVTGPDAWDGYAATVLADAGVAALSSLGDRVAVDLVDKPELYA